MLTWTLIGLLVLMVCVLIVLGAAYLANRSLNQDFAGWDAAASAGRSVDFALKSVAFVAVIAAVLIGLHLCAMPAHADDGLGPWFKSLQVPGTGGSCCDESDCRRLAPSEWRVGQDGYEILVEGQWLKVPDTAILQHKSNPTGDPVACVFYGRILCFVRPVEA